MKPLTLLQSDPTLRVESRGHSSCNVQNLENRILAQATSVQSVAPTWAAPILSISSCSALQPSYLSSTQLKQDLFPLPTSSSLCSPLSLSSEQQSTLPPAQGLSAGGLTAGGLSTGAVSASGTSFGGLSSEGLSARGHSDGALLCSGLAGGPSGGLSLCPDKEHPSLACTERTVKQVSLCFTEDDQSHNEELTKDWDQEGLVEMDQSPQSEEPVLTEDEEKCTVELGEEFAVPETAFSEEAAMLKDAKYNLLNCVLRSLVSKSCFPGQKNWDKKKSVWIKIRNLAETISCSDSEFLLKVAVYTQELKKRLMTSYLLALAAYLPHCKPHLRRYFCAAVQLPSDWLQVVTIYSTCFGSSLPTCLKKSLVDKFKQFTEAQLAQYSTRRQRKRRATLQKDQKEFSIQKLIKHLHIKKPAELVMSLLGKKYPADAKAFERSGLSGVWQSERAGQRMKLKKPDTWKTTLGREGSKPATWEKMIDRNSLPLVVMLKNLRNIIVLGISAKHHDKVLRRLTSESAVIQSKLLPFSFFAAYKVIMQLSRFDESAEKPTADSSKVVLQGIMARFRKSKRSQDEDCTPPGRRKLRAAFRVPFMYRLYKVKQRLLQKARQRKFSQELLERYLQALLKAVEISCRFNIPLLPGRTLICISQYFYDYNWKKAGEIFLPPDPAEDVEKTFPDPIEDAGKTLPNPSQNPEETLPEPSENPEKALPEPSENPEVALPEPSENPEEDLPEPSENPEEDLPEPSENLEEEPANKMQEAAFLLAMMLRHGCEHSQVLIIKWQELVELDIKSGSLLENVRDGIKQAKAMNHVESPNETSYSNFFSKLTRDKMQVDNIFVFTDCDTHTSLVNQVKTYCKSSNNDTLLVYLQLNPYTWNSFSDKDPYTVCLCDFSKQFLKFASERGSNRLLNHVENIDKLYEIPPAADVGDKSKKTGSAVALPATPKLRWREVRVLISSSLRDMYFERDVLVRSVFPELRRRVAPYCLYLQEVELRCGLSEEESSQAVQLCMSEVGHSQLLFGILGEKYGPVVPRPLNLTSLPQYSWLNSAPSGMSITEMEIRQFQSLYPKSAQSRMFFYFRSPHLVSSIPVAWKADFTAESRESAAKMDDLKEWIWKNQFRVRENYPCEWGGVVDGQACVKGLEEFEEAVKEDLWAALQELFLEKDNEDDVTLEINKQEIHQEAQRQHFYGRRKLLSMAIEKVKECQQKGVNLLVEGRPGVGKTAFLAALAGALLTPDHKKSPLCDVISYSTAVSQLAGSISQLLCCLVQRLRKMDSEEELTSSMSYRALLSEFHLHLSERREGPPLAVLIDGVDLIYDAEGQVLSEWIPEHLPKGVCLVLSVTTGSVLCDALRKKKCCMSFPLGELTSTDSREIVQKELGVDGKELSNPAFSKQLQTLLMKKEAICPLYLRLACEELRNLSSFQEMKKSLQALPQSLSELVQLRLLRLQSQFGVAGLDWALAALTVSSTGLRERDLYPLLNLCSDLSSTKHFPSWQETLQLARKPKSRVPMAVFFQLAQNLLSLVRPSVPHTSDELLNLTNEDMRIAFQQLYISTEEARIRAHLILAAHLWIRSDPHGNDTFLHCDEDALAQLLNHLIKCDQRNTVRSLLSNYYFQYANVRHRLLRRLLENFALFYDSDDLQQCADFLKRHARILSDWPALFVQQALNEAEGSPAHVWAQRMIEQGGVRALKRLNKTKHAHKQTSELVSRLLWAPSCVAVSPGGGHVVVGTEKGTLHVFLSKTSKTQEVKSLVSSYDGISGCVFLEESVVCITSYSGHVEVWNIHSGCRMSRLKVHSSRITGCDVSSNRRLFATISLDFTLKVWLTQGLQQVMTLIQPSAPNCVTFDPEGRLVGVGCWDGAVRVWDWKRRENQATLSGHQSSVVCLLFSPSSSSLLCSGSMDGEVRLWSVPAVSCMWHCQAHCGSVTAVSFLSDGETPLSAGQDGTVQLRGLLYCFAGAVRALASGRDGRFFSVSDDRFLRAWNITTERPHIEKFLTAVCFLEKGELLACGFVSGTLELWHHNLLIYSKKVNDSCIQAVTGMPDKQLAVACSDCSVTVWRWDLDSQPGTAELSKVSLYTTRVPLAYLLYNNTLLGVCDDSFITDISSKMNTMTYRQYDWINETRPLGIVKNDEKSIWFLGEHNCELRLILTISIVSGKHWHFAFCDDTFGAEEEHEEVDESPFEDQSEEQSNEACEEKCEEQSVETSEKAFEETHEELSMEESRGQSEEACEEHCKEMCEQQSEEACEDPCEEMHEEQPENPCEAQSEEQSEAESREDSEEYKRSKVRISAADIYKGFIVCGDTTGRMWTNQPPSMSTWSEKRQAHSDQISVLRLTDTAIISASYDGTIKLWDRDTNKQVGLFVCGAPVQILEVNQDDPSQLVCGDAAGQVYILSWTG